MASILIYWYFYYLMVTIDRAVYNVWLHFCELPHYAEREKKHLIFAQFILLFAVSGNQTRAAWAASKCAIHYCITSRQTSLDVWHTF